MDGLNLKAAAVGLQPGRVSTRYEVQRNCQDAMAALPEYFQPRWDSLDDIEPAYDGNGTGSFDIVASGPTLSGPPAQRDSHWRIRGKQHPGLCRVRPLVVGDSGTVVKADQMQAKADQMQAKADQMQADSSAAAPAVTASKRAGDIVKDLDPNLKSKRRPSGSRTAENARRVAHRLLARYQKARHALLKTHAKTGVRHSTEYFTDNEPEGKGKRGKGKRSKGKDKSKDKGRNASCVVSCAAGIFTRMHGNPRSGGLP